MQRLAHQTQFRLFALADVGEIQVAHMQVRQQMHRAIQGALADGIFPSQTLLAGGVELHQSQLQIEGQDFLDIGQTEQPDQIVRRLVGE